MGIFAIKPSKRTQAALVVRQTHCDGSGLARTVASCRAFAGLVPKERKRFRALGEGRMADSDRCVEKSQ